MSLVPVVLAMGRFCRYQAHLALRHLLDPVDAHGDLVAEAIGAFSSPTDERGAEWIQLEVVAAELAGGQEALEETVEANEDAGPDRADDLPAEGRVPARLEQPALEQPGEAELVGAVLDLGRFTLALGRPLRQLVEIIGGRLVGEPEQREQRAMADEVGVAADRRGEVAVGPTREPGVTEVARVVARLLERAEDERRKSIAASLRAHHVIRHADADLRGETGGVRRREVVGGGRRRDPEVRELAQQQLDRL